MNINQIMLGEVGIISGDTVGFSGTDQLEAMLNVAGYSTVRVTGYYLGTPEQAVIVTGLSKSHIVGMGKLFSQESVTYGHNGRFLLLECETGKVWGKAVGLHEVDDTYPNRFDLDGKSYTILF